VSVSFRFIRDGDDCTTVAVAGDVEYENATDLVEAFRGALSRTAGGSGTDRRGTARVDLADVGFLDSMGLSALLTCRQLAMDQGTSFAVVNPATMPYRVISLAGLAGTLGLAEPPR